MLRTRTKNTSNTPSRLPPWLRRHIRESEDVHALKKMLKEHNLHTVCQSAGCPNIAECFKKPTATFMILGDICTRNCRFCGVSKGDVLPVDPDEPRRIAKAARLLDLKHIVVTSVTRDDLPDDGAGQFAETVERIHRSLPDTSIEVLIPDFYGHEESLMKVLESPIDILNHNIETVPRLYPEVRPEADFERSLGLLRKAKKFYPDLLTKSGLMVGLGETFGEVIDVLSRLHEVDCDAITIGQYLAPSRQSYPVHEYILPKTFDAYRDVALKIGFHWVNAGPFVRSSFNAEKLMMKCKETRGE